MTLAMFQEILIPFIGTTLGAACVFLLKKPMGKTMQRCLSGFAAGVMVAASIWSLLIPSMEHASHMGTWSFVPAAGGFWIGILFLLLLDKVIPHMHSEECEGPHCNLGKSTMMVLAVALHNLPEGIAVGVIYAGLQAGMEEVTAMGALALSIGIAIQNFPEGAIISLPLRSQGLSKGRSFLYGVLSGIVEPAAALITILCADALTPVLPYLLSFAAGAMIYVVVEELIPEMSEGGHSNIGTILFSVGFTVMMALDVVLG